MTAARTTISTRALALLGLLSACAGAADGDSILANYTLEADSMEQWRLPGRLREISGLAITADQRVFAIEDERAIVYQLDVDEGRLLKAFALGTPVQRGDFEGLAVVGRSFFLVTSDGDIYRTAEGVDGEQVAYRRYVTRLGKRCEIEGLAASADDSHLLIACKERRRRGEPLAIHAWSIAGQRLDPERVIVVPEQQILEELEESRFNPSGLHVDRDSGHLLLVAARQRALVELDATGSLIEARRLPLAQRHRQPEGIERLADGRLLLSDEGGSRKARLAAYRPMD